MTLQQFLSSYNQNKVNIWKDRFQNWLIKERRLIPDNKSENMWIDLWKDFMDEVTKVDYPLNTRPNRR